MILLITGGRDVTDVGMVFDVIVATNEAMPISYIVHGDATGADSLADKVALNLGINRIKVPANWNKYHKAAGAIRNKDMLDLFDIGMVLAFPGGKGTANMVAQATKRDIPVVYATDIIAGNKYTE